jgi:hypothetical protein
MVNCFFSLIWNTHLYIRTLIQSEGLGISWEINFIIDIYEKLSDQYPGFWTIPGFVLV